MSITMCSTGDVRDGCALDSSVKKNASDNIHT
jgi:hypothetical protein